ncbi:lipopolysaccharide biosynthesis protein [Bradyrhizobium sp. GCM10028915]|uniref:lipopolysaccharide biosynthesis protein n=1 Tax=Bradyrhizobium sp. GCM10028915 TaxID=3273385 RepID=UPI00360D6456
MRISLKNNWLSGIVYLGVAGVSGFGSSLAVLTFLSPEDAGFFLLCQAQVAFIMLFDCGLLLTATRELAFAHGRDDAVGVEQPNHQTFLTTFAIYRDARAFILLGLFCAWGIFLVAFACIPAISGSANIVSLLLAMVAGAIALLGYLYQSVLEGGGLYYIERYVSAAAALGSLAFISIAAYFAREPNFVFMAWYSAFTLALVAKGIAANRSFPKLKFRGVPRFRNLVLALKSSFSIGVLQAGAVVTKYLQYPVVAHFVELKYLGSYLFVSRISATIDQAVAILAVSERAKLSRAIGAGKFNDARKIMVGVGIKVTLGAIVAGIFVSSGLPHLFRLAMGSRDVTHVPFVIIGLDLIAMCVSGSLTQMVIATGRNPFHKMVALTALVTVCLLVILVPRYGLAGAAASQAIGGAVTNLWFSVWQFILALRRFDERSKTPLIEF